MRMDAKTLVMIALAAQIVWLGVRVHRRSVQRDPIHGGALAALFNLLSGMCFIAILPTVCASVLLLHPDMLSVAGVAISPIIAIVVVLAVLSLVFSVLFAVFERAPLERAQNERALRESQGWTEQDARTSGL